MSSIKRSRALKNYAGTAQRKSSPISSSRVSPQSSIKRTQALKNMITKNFKEPAH